MKLLAVTLTAFLTLLQYQLWIAPAGVPDIWHLERNVSAQHTLNDKLRERNRVLVADVSDLRNGREAIEGQARQELGMIRSDEEFYQIITT